MRPLLRRIPQLQRLAVVDAVASTGGFTAAAHELGVSQPAVSRHIATLERQLGVDLFERSGGSIRLTEPGRRLADGIASAFAGLERSLDQIVVDREAMVFAVQPSMATSWIVPSLDQLADVAGSEIRLRIFDRESELSSGQWDAAIVPGDGAWPGWTTTQLFSEAVRPLASPQLASALGLDADSTPDELLAATTLLHIDALERPSMTWEEWSERAGATQRVPMPLVVYDAYATVVQEALAGHGVVLGWRHLVGDLIERRLLVPVGPLVERPETGHYLCWPDADDDPRLDAIRSWLVSHVAAADASIG